MPKISRKNLSQMMMVGFEGKTLPKFYGDWLGDGLGGIVLFSRNIESPKQLAELTSEIQKQSRSIPAFIGVDQEGGRVFRLKDPFTLFPSARVMGEVFDQTQSTELVYEAAKATARELSAMGINLNFAPVLDVDSNPKNPIIGDRAYSKDPNIVSQLGLAVMQGLMDGGVMACGKHFPGHGGTSKDSHLELPVLKKNILEMKKEELIPFAQAILSQIPMLMTAHVLYPTLDEKYPATLSEKIMENLLRYEMSYDGIVISDDLEMKAIYGKNPVREVVEKAVNAGIDILLVCKERKFQEEVFEALVDCIETKDISQERIKKSLGRIQKAKKKFLKQVHPFPQEEWQAIIGCADHKRLAQELNRFA